MKTEFKQLNYQLSNGLFVVNAKIKRGSDGTICPVVSFFMTDHIENTKVLFDLSSQKIVYSKYPLSIPEKDIGGLVAALNLEPKKVVVSG
jgi:hypothetical protein